MRITSGGNVGIGTTAPTFKLQLIDSSNAGLRVQTNTAGGTVASFGSSGSFRIDAPGDPGGRFTVLEGGAVGIGDDFPANKLSVLDIGNTGLRVQTNTGGGTVASFGPNGAFQIDKGVGNPGGRFTVLENGNVGVGASTPAFKLHVVDVSNSGLRVQTNTTGGTVASFGGNGAFQIDAPGVAGGRLAVLQNGNVGIGTASPAQSLHVNGQVLSTGAQAGFKFRDPDSGEDWIWHASLNNLVTNARLTFNGHEVIRVIPNADSLGNGSVIVDYLEVQKLNPAGSTSVCLDSGGILAHCSSSLRYKTNIAPFSSGLNLIRQLRPILFDWKKGGMHDVGFGAEDVAKINPLFVSYNNAGQVEGVKYDRLSTVFVNAFIEQQSQIERQQEEIQKQQTAIESLKRLVCADHPNADACKAP
jgi:hypothetical protein